MLKSLVIVPNERTKDLGAILQIARSLAKRKEHVDQDIPIVSLLFDPLTRVYVAIYEWCSNPQEPRKEPNNG
jgi:hypothetical protein